MLILRQRLSTDWIDCKKVEYLGIVLFGIGLQILKKKDTNLFDTQDSDHLLNRTAVQDHIRQILPLGGQMKHCSISM